MKRLNYLLPLAWSRIGHQALAQLNSSREIIERQISSSSDDAEEERNGSVNLNSSDIDLLDDGDNAQIIGLRFNNIHIPDDKVVREAYIEFTADSDNAGDPNLKITTHLDANSSSFAAGRGFNNDISRRNTSNETVIWEPEDWSRKRQYRTPNLLTLVNEIIALPSWENGNAISFILTGESDEDNKRAAISYDEDPNKAAKLVLELEDLVIPLPPATRFIFEQQISRDTDDAEEEITGHTINLYSEDLELGNNLGNDEEQIVGLRFDDIEVPANSVIEKAYIQFTAESSDSGPQTFIISGEDIQESVTFNDNDRNISRRSKTQESVSWIPGEWRVSSRQRNTTYDTDDLSTIVHELITSNGWKYGDPITFIIEGEIGNKNKRVAFSFDESENRAAKLIIEYSEPTPITTDFEQQISIGEDDAEEHSDGTVDLGSQILELGFKEGLQIVGLRFDDITIPSNSVIEQAYIQMTRRKDSQEELQLTISGEDAANSASFIAADGDISSRARTDQSVAWTPVNRNVGRDSRNSDEELIESPNLSSVVSEIIGSNEWESGNPITFFITGEDDNTSKMEALSFEANVNKSAKLIINYSDFIERVDLELTTLVSPAGSDFANQTSTVEVEVTNLSNIDLDAFDITYFINGVEIATQQVQSTVTAGARASFTFDETFDENTIVLDARDSYELRVEVSHIDDENLDNNTITNTIPINIVDLALTSIVSPSGSHFSSHASVVEVEIANFGNVTADQYAVSYSINGGDKVTQQNKFPLSIDGNASFVFDQTVNETNIELAEDNAYHLSIEISSVYDQNESNNTIDTRVTVDKVNLAISAILAPSESHQPNSNSSVIVEIANLGNTPVRADAYQILYAIDGGRAIAESGVDDIPAGGSVHFTFMQAFNENQVAGSDNSYDLSVEVLVNNDESISNNIMTKTITIFALPDIAQDEGYQQLQVYPNPAAITSAVNIHLKNSLETAYYSYIIVNQHGELEDSGQVNTEQPAINVATLSTGVYIVMIQDANGVIIKRERLIISD
jgi:hypothetical protein